MTGRALASVLWRRRDASTHRYESAGGRFVADLTVNAEGFVTRYPGFVEALATT